MDPLSTSLLFEQFLSQRRYLKNVTPSTIEWYQTAFKGLQKALGTDAPSLTKPSLQQFVISIRQRGVKPVSCNTYIKALNAFCLWLHEEGHALERLQLPLLKVEQRIIQTLSDPAMQTLLNQKPKRFDQWRLHALVCLLLDAGLRIEEALTLRRTDLDFDSLLVTVLGKGRKERRIPFSFELRKVLFRYEQVRLKQCPRCVLAFPSRQGTHWDQRNSLRGLHLLQAKLDLPTFGWHRLPAALFPGQAALKDETWVCRELETGDIEQTVTVTHSDGSTVSGESTFPKQGGAVKRQTPLPEGIVMVETLVAPGDWYVTVLQNGKQVF